MSDSGRADEVYQPADTADEQADASALDLQNALDERTYDDILDEGWSPPERPFGVRQAGTTAGEQREGETLDQRLARELPDEEPDGGDRIGDLPGGDGEPVDPEAGTERAGRLVAPDEGAHDRTTELFAEDVGIDAGAACAEEAAVHIVPDSALDGQGGLDEDSAWP
ncbi:DUF5709 domain-containing protein [Streptomyces sp. NRRL B-24484]|uniref:DUF5709 domain-containing protein n=1 Tax=Streptomyces sp. NRRL B-24484 TaxID=1463833 RepID=UPI0005BA7EA4|nr:DUF5709 domain-containing protein [Streptomyces sp. NRRL B-24484]